MELNAIVMRACKLNPQQRYASARQMHEDLLLLMAGNSVRRSHALERQLAWMRRIGLAFGTIAVLLAVPCYLAIKQAQRAKRSERKEYEQQLRAEAEAAKNRSMAQFLKKMLRGLEPSFALGQDTAMSKTFLDQTAEQIAKDLQSQPGLEAEMRTTLGSLYFQLGYPSQAESMYAKALALQQTVHTQDHPAVAQALSDLSCALCTQGKLRDAETLQNQALAMRRKFSGDNRVALSESLHGLGWIFFSQSRLAESEAAFKEALTLREQTSGDTVELAESLTDMGRVLAGQGRWSDAEVHFQRALEIERKLFREEDPHVALLLGGLVSSLIAQGKLPEAEARAREALAIRQKVFNSDHPAIAESLTTLADALRSQRKFAEAETRLHEALAIRQKRFGNNDPALAETLNVLVDTLLLENKNSQAEQVLNEVLASAAAQPSARLFRARGNFLAQLCRWHEAERDFAEAIDLEPGNHEAYHELAPLYVQSDDLEAYRQLRLRIKQRFGSILDDPSIADRMGKDCLILPPSGELSVEKRWAEVAVNLCKSERAKPWAQFFRSLAEYRQGHFAEAVSWAQSALTRSGDIHSRDVETYMVMAMALFKSNKVPEARDAFMTGQHIADTRLPNPEQGPLHDSWKDCLIAFALMREAKALLNGLENTP